MSRKPNEGLEELGGRKKLSPNELELMQYLWSCPEGISSEKIYAHFPQSRSTKSTVLAKLTEKGYVKNKQEGLHHIYTCMVSRVEYERAMIHHQMKEVSGGDSFVHLIASFCGKESLTEQQQEKVREILKEIMDDSEDRGAEDCSI